MVKIEVNNGCVKIKCEGSSTALLGESLYGIDALYKNISKITEMPIEEVPDFVKYVLED